MVKYLFYFSFTLVLLGLISCLNLNSSGRIEFTASEPVGSSVQKTNGEYILQLGDVIDIKFYYHPELNERVIIRPDGKISLQLIDEVMGAGLTPSELDSILTEKYSKTLRGPEVAVIVKEFAGHKVYVGGEVESPGLFPTTGNLTALQAILQAGGFKDTAQLSNVVILRNQGPQEVIIKIIDLKKDLMTHASYNDILLKPYDIVFVPKTTIAKINQFIAQYIDKLIPIARMVGFNWVYNLNPDIRIK